MSRSQGRPGRRAVVFGSAVAGILALGVAGAPASAVPVEDPPAPDVLLDVTGPLFVVTRDFADPLQRPAEREVSVVVGDILVPIDPAAVGEAHSGDVFDGIVAVPTELALDLSRQAARAVEQADGVPLDGASDVGEEILELVEASGDALDVLDVETREAASPALTPLAHTLRIAVVSPAGATNGFATEAATDLASDAEAYWWGQSVQNITELRGPVLHYTSAYTCSAREVDFWVEALANFGIAQNLNQFIQGSAGAHVAVLLPAACENDQPLGVANVGDHAHDNGVSLVVLGQGLDRTVLVHELGHNMGLDHANVALCDDGAVAGCPVYEYAAVSRVRWARA